MAGNLGDEKLLQTSQKRQTGIEQSGIILVLSFPDQ
jgi:hypothetical protein